MDFDLFFGFLSFVLFVLHVQVVLFGLLTSDAKMIFIVVGGF